MHNGDTKENALWLEPKGTEKQDKNKTIQPPNQEIRMIINLHESKDSYPSKKSYNELEREVLDLKFELAALKSEYAVTKNLADILQREYLKPKKSWSFV